jgi:hypothetical protein
MAFMTDLVHRYLAIWQETDPDARRAAITKIWSADAQVYTGANEYTGHQAIDARVTAAHDKWVAAEGYVFRLLGDADIHHDGIRIRWEMVPAAGGEAASTGVQFLLLDPDGLARVDYQFIDG